MREDEEAEREERQAPFNEEQQQMFANENRAANATLPPVGSQVDPILPGVPTAEEDAAADK